MQEILKCSRLQTPNSSSAHETSPQGSPRGSYLLASGSLSFLIVRQG